MCGIAGVMMRGGRPPAPAVLERMAQALRHRGPDGEGTRIVKLPLLPEGGRRALTFYTRHGDVFGWACVALMALRFGPIAWRAVRSAKFFRRAVKA